MRNKIIYPSLDVCVCWSVCERGVSFDHSLFSTLLYVFLTLSSIVPSAEREMSWSVAVPRPILLALSVDQDAAQ